MSDMWYLVGWRLDGPLRRSGEHLRPAFKLHSVHSIAQSLYRPATALHHPYFIYTKLEILFRVSNVQSCQMVSGAGYCPVTRVKRDGNINTHGKDRKICRECYRGS